MNKPIYTKWWFWVLAVIIIGAIGNMGDDKNTTDQAVTSATIEPAKVVVAEATEEAVIVPTQKPKEVSKSDPTVAPTENPIPGTIGMTPEEFRKEFNARADSMESKLKISKKLTVEDGLAQDTFQYMFNDFLGITGSVNKADGSIRDIMMIGRGDGTSASGANIIVVMGLVILAVNPDIESTEVGSIITDLKVLEDGVDLAKIDESTVRNGIRYHVQGSNELGLMFSAGDANDK
ncbi:hypothetical protein [Paenibacillus borealis]|uniref:Uncharacterized protein n=1 Tax=Paenibacillus borealis TaxID=160799 RepID=A0A089LKG8_PAEBO|nr:hypothetical protein [Paenibacillus borealis]AIQ59663.1 hypothetical protein PBOR_23920 [Paenibacillus borealis]